MEVKVTQAEAVRNFYRRQGAEQEQLRIIKLLKDDFWHHRIIIDEKPTCLASCDMCKLIALIKGDTK